MKNREMVELITVLDIAQESVEEDTTVWKLIQRALVILKTNND